MLYILAKLIILTLKQTSPVSLASQVPAVSPASKERAQEEGEERKGKTHSFLSDPPTSGGSWRFFCLVATDASLDASLKGLQSLRAGWPAGWLGNRCGLLGGWPRGRLQTVLEALEVLESIVQAGEGWCASRV